VGGAFAHVARRGDDDAGAVLVKVALPGRMARLYGPARDGSGARIYVRLAGSGPDEGEAEVDAYLARRVRNDPDIWIVEIEDRLGRHFLTERVD
jgi:hypothetical protein